MQRFVHRLSRLLLALALVGLALGQTGARVHVAALVPAPHGHAAMEHAGHHAHGRPAPAKADHSDLRCVTACCMAVSTWTEPAFACAGVHFAAAALYGALSEPGSGRSEAPEPGIPKHRA
jgi:hypothetical protein